MRDRPAQRVSQLHVLRKYKLIQPCINLPEDMSITRTKTCKHPRRCAVCLPYHNGEVWVMFLDDRVCGQDKLPADVIMKHMSDCSMLKNYKLTACPPKLGLTGSKRCEFRGERETMFLQTRTWQELNEIKSQPIWRQTTFLQRFPDAASGRFVERVLT